jgi:hypothetical protein
MRKALLLFLLAVLAGVGIETKITRAQDANAEAPKSKKAGQQLRWDGHIVRMDKDNSTMDIRDRRGMERKIHWNTSTTWTKLNKPVTDQSEFKEDARVIVLGKSENGQFMATRIDLRVNP